jgi:hypothetical protein
MKKLNGRRRGVFAAALVAGLLTAGTGTFVAPVPSASAAGPRWECGSWNQMEKASKLAWRPCYEQTIPNDSATWIPTRAFIEVLNRSNNPVTLDVKLSTFQTHSLGTRRYPDRSGQFSIKAGAKSVVARTDLIYLVPGENGRLSGRFTVKDPRSGTLVNSSTSSWRIDIVKGYATT